MEEKEHDERAVEVRGLDGTSTVVSISSDHTVGDLKALLKESFPPAAKSPDFRLFYKVSARSRFLRCLLFVCDCFSRNLLLPVGVLSSSSLKSSRWIAFRVIG